MAMKELKKTYARITATDDTKWKNEIMPELMKPYNIGLPFLTEYRKATGQPCPGSNPCKNPSIMTPM